MKNPRYTGELNKPIVISVVADPEEQSRIYQQAVERKLILLARQFGTP